MLSAALTRARTYLLPIGLLIVTWVVLTLTTPTFTGEASVFSVLEGFPLTGLVALGVGVTIVAGELDLSVGSMAALAGVIAIKAGDTGLVGAIAIAVAVGAVLGAIQGFVIAWLSMNSLLLTVGTLTLLRGLTYVVSGNQSIELSNFAVSNPLLEQHGVFSVSSITALVGFGVVGLFLAYTRWGREIYAIGGGREEARAAGVRRLRPMIVTFALSGGCAALAGALASMKGGSAAPQNYDDVLLVGVAAALVGGVSLYGGRGTVLHIALGVGIFSAVAAGLTARGGDESLTQLVTGTLLLVIITIEFVTGRARRRAESGRAGVWRHLILRKGT